MSESADAFRRRLRTLGAELAGRGELVRDAHAAGITKTEIHRITGIARTTIDRITGTTYTDLEARVSRELHAEADQIGTDPDALDKIRQRIAEES